jgi:hypothetical protein
MRIKFALLAALTVLPLAAHAQTTATTHNQNAVTYPSPYPDQYYVQLDPAAAPADFTTSPQPLQQLNNSEDFFLVNPGGNSIGGGSN